MAAQEWKYQSGQYSKLQKGLSGDNYGGSSSTQLNVHHKTSHLKMGLESAWTTLHSINIHGSWKVMGRDHELNPSHSELCEAASKGDWKRAEEMEKTTHNGSVLLSGVICNDRQETALHIATRFNRDEFVEKLVQKLTKQDLEAKNIYGNTALCIAATSGAVQIAESMVRRHNDLVLTRGSGNATPVLIAARYKHNLMVSYLLEAMDSIGNRIEIHEQMELLLTAISADQYDIAILILEWNKSLALMRDTNEDTPLHIMARKSNVIGSKNKPTKWQSLFITTNISCSKHIFKKKEMQIEAHKTVELMWNVVEEKIKKDGDLHMILHPSSMLHDAASVGNVEFVRVLLQNNPALLRMVDGSGKTIFHVAVEHRQRHVFNLIYDMKLFNPDDLLYYFNEQNISLLELAAKIPHPTHLHHISGAVFQIHQELLWFKEVENIMELTVRINLKGQKEIREKFTQEHRALVKEGEKWVKSTANSCMLVATLIATVAFSAAFTIPGGNNDNTGSPMFLTQTWFTVFVISDAIALVSSSTSILLFLSILTSRCAENDFLFLLPMELVLGLASLFVSVLGMVLAFSASYFLYCGKQHSWIPLVVTLMATVPIYWFSVLLWKLWADGLAALHATGMSYLSKARKC